MRLFFAIMLPDETIAQVRQLQDSLRAAIGDEGVRWTSSAQFHYTLRFLGEASQQQLTVAVEAARTVATASAPFTFFPSGLDVFPTRRRPQVLWIGVERREEQAEGTQALHHLAANLEAALVERGFAAEERAFRAHLTLARIKTRAGEIATARALPQWIGRERQAQPWYPIPVDQFTLLNSELRPDGAIYTLLEMFPLSSSPGPD